MDYTNDLKKYIDDELQILKNIDLDTVNEVIKMLEETRLNSKRVFVIGNGGSAATASHMYNDFNKGISEHLEKKYNFVSLCDNFATVMAIANDDCYENVFVNQLTNNIAKGDVLIAISGSGNSENIIKACEYAKKCGNKVIGFSGYDGGRLKKISDINLHVDINNMQIVEDIHMVFNHMMMYVLCKTLKEPGGNC